MIDQLLGNWVYWVILLTALACYQQLMLQFFQYKHTSEASDQQLCSVMISALPLLGLLGTIIGLLQCFAEMATGNIVGDTLSGGIANALLTTQLGLVCAIPAWLLQAYLRSTQAIQKAHTNNQGEHYASAP